MNQIKRLSLSEEAVSRLIDPRTGQRLRPLGVVGGRVVWPMMGASPDDPSDRDEDRDTDDDDDKDPEDKDSSSKDSDRDKDDADKGNPEAKIAALEDEKQRQYRRRQEAEKERDELKQRLEALEDKDKDENTKTAEKVQRLESENSELLEALRERTLENAFLKDNTYSWHNPGRALRLADLSEVEIDDDGNVHGLKAALDKLAKSDAYLIKQEEDREKDEDKTSTGGSKNKSKKDKQRESADAQKKRLHDKYPALRR